MGSGFYTANITTIHRLARIVFNKLLYLRSTRG